MMPQSQRQGRRGGGLRGVSVGMLVAVLLAGCAGGSSNPGGAATSSGAAPRAAAPAGGAGSPSAPTDAAGSPASAPAGPLERVTLGFSARSVSFLPQLMAKTLGYYEAEGLNVEPIVMRSDLQMAGLLSGELDYSCTGGDPLL